MKDSVMNGLVRPEEMASQLGITTRTLKRWETKGEGPPITRIGQRVFYRVESAIQWVREREESE